VYFKRAAAFGIFPSAGTRLYTVPALHTLVKPLHEHYLLLVQKLNEAGWEPVTGVTGLAPGIVGERFGRRGAGAVYLTFFNDGTAAVDLKLRLDEEIFGAARAAAGVDGERPAELAIKDGGFGLRLGAGDLRVVEIR
jgi:hypothetical protein